MSVLRTNTDARAWLEGFDPDPVPRLVRVMRFTDAATKGLKKRRRGRKK